MHDQCFNVLYGVLIGISNVHSINFNQTIHSLGLSHLLSNTITKQSYATERLNKT